MILAPFGPKKLHNCRPSLEVSHFQVKFRSRFKCILTSDPSSCSFKNYISLVIDVNTVFCIGEGATLFEILSGSTRKRKKKMFWGYF